jgi:ribosomal protein S18 acetylase RimI-like enzyme
MANTVGAARVSRFGSTPLSDQHLVDVCEPSCVAGAEIVEVSQEQMDELEPLWRALYDHHDEISPHLRDRRRPYERSWKLRRQSERALLQSEPGSFVLAAVNQGRYVGYAFVRVRPGAGFAATWTISDPYAELYTLSVLPECRRQLTGSALMDAVETRLRELDIADMIIGVVATNVAAIGFYERRGAARFDTRLIQRVQPGRAAHDGP